MMTQIKPLEWEYDVDRPEEFPAWAAWPEGMPSYRIFKAWWGMRGKWGYVCNGAFHHTVEDAKAAAQADYEARMRSQIAPVSAPDDVAVLRGELRIIGCHSNGDARCTCIVGAEAADTIEAQAADIARLTERVKVLTDALRLHQAWSDSEDAGPDYGGQTRDTHPDGERIWRQWWDGNLDLCGRAQEATRAALADASKG